jgi:hypothetical protein
MKMIYETQLSKVHSSNQISAEAMQNNFFRVQPYSPLAIYSEDVQKTSFSLLYSYTSDPRSFVKYP